MVLNHVYYFQASAQSVTSAFITIFHIKYLPSNILPQYLLPPLLQKQYAPPAKEIHGSYKITNS